MPCRFDLCAAVVSVDFRNVAMFVLLSSISQQANDIIINICIWFLFVTFRTEMVHWLMLVHYITYKFYMILTSIAMFGVRRVHHKCTAMPNGKSNGFITTIYQNYNMHSTAKLRRRKIWYTLKWMKGNSIRVSAERNGSSTYFDDNILCSQSVHVDDELNSDWQHKIIVILKHKLQASESGK